MNLMVAICLGDIVYYEIWHFSLVLVNHKHRVICLLCEDYVMLFSGFWHKLAEKWSLYIKSLVLRVEMIAFYLGAFFFFRTAFSFLFSILSLDLTAWILEYKFRKESR